jgi:hypothetical protein
VGVRGVRSQGENSPGEGVGQGYCGDEAALAAGKAVSMSGFQGRTLGLPENAAVSRQIVPGIPGRKRH